MPLFFILPLSAILFALAANGDQITVRISPPTDSYQVSMFCWKRHIINNQQWEWNHEIGAGIQPIGQPQVQIDLADLRSCLDNELNFTIRSTTKDSYGLTNQYDQIFLKLAHLEQTNTLEISVDKTNIVTLKVKMVLPFSNGSSSKIVTFYCFVASADDGQQNDQKSLLLFGRGHSREAKLNQLEERHRCLGQEIIADIYAQGVGLIKKERIAVSEFDKMIDAKLVELGKVDREEVWTQTGQV